MFICGSASFSHHRDHEDEELLSSYPAPKRTRKSLSFCRIGKNYTSMKNPYANRGLDKFYALLSELDETKQRIYTRMGSEDISFVQFVYSNDSRHIKPIVVRVKERKQETNNPKNEEVRRESDERVAGEKQNKKSFLRCTESFKVENFRQPYHVFLVIVILILLCMAIFGRSFVILCASVGWYLIPGINGESLIHKSSSNTRKPKRKEFDRKLSEINKSLKDDNDAVLPSSPTSVINGLIAVDKSVKKQSGQGKFKAGELL